MRSFHPFLLACLVFFPAVVHAAAKPNILFILADDLGWKDVGYQGSDFYETPHLDRLAKEGMVFGSAYAGGANCQPSRACLLSGQYTPRHEVYAVDSTERGPKELMRLVPVPNRHGLASENVTLAEALKAAGYVTGLFGKWHLAGADGAPPRAQGFEVVHESYAGWKDATPEPANPKGIYSLTRAAGEFMEKNKDRPFFAFVSHYAIHSAQQARPSTLERFKTKPPGAQHRRPLYAACLYDLDDGVGLLLRKLADLGLDRNTLVVFTSDNGGTQQSSQESLRGNKGCYYEGGIREPLIVRWPGVVKPATRCEVPVIHLDLYPTFLAAASAPPPAGKVLDGESLLPLLRGEGALRREALFWHFPGYLDNPVLRGRDPIFRTRPVSVIRQGDWKLHLYHEEWLLEGGRAKLDTNQAVELYNVREDIGERTDLALSHQAKRDELLDDLLAWFNRTNAKLASKQNSGSK